MKTCFSIYLKLNNSKSQAKPRIIQNSKLKIPNSGVTHPFVFCLFFPFMGACYAQTKGFTLGRRELVLVRPNVKPFCLNSIEFAPISGLWSKVFVKALTND